MVLPVRPGAEPVSIHVAVPRTQEGRALLADLNPLILKARVDPEFRALVDRWSDDETRALVLRLVRGLGSSP